MILRYALQGLMQNKYQLLAWKVVPLKRYFAHNGFHVLQYILSVPSRLYEGLNKLIEVGYRLLSKHGRELKKDTGVSTISYLHYTTKEVT